MIKDHYKIEVSMSATLSAQVVEQIIKQAVEEQTERVVENITVTYDGTKFAGYHVTFRPEHSRGYKSSKEFVEQKWR